MDISKYSLEDLLLAAIKSEIEAEDMYRKLSERAKDPFLRGRLEFLANEEKGHKAYLEAIFKKTFPSKGLVLPENDVVPLPSVHMYSDDGSIRAVVAVLDDAMKAESAAADFYASLESRFEDEKIKKTLHYLSLMEKDHYSILKMERDEIAEVEDAMDEFSYNSLDGVY